MSIYALKTRFQGLLRPLVRELPDLGFTANQVTLTAAVLSLLAAAVIYHFAPAQAWLYLVLPVWMLLRMALNAIDGMLAREFGQQSRLGAYLNELCDVLADVALYLSLASLPGVHVAWLALMAGLAVLTEYAGVLGLMVGASRRYDGPMGKSDRALVIGVIGLLLALGWIDASVIDGVAIVVAVLCTVTIWRRVRAGLVEGLRQA
ncbi:MAG: CDP-alcohol phosphatidyltransferase family protein [Luteimonas sp.]